MDIKEFEKNIVEKMEHIGISIDKQKVEQFYKYMNLLLEWNEKINLTSITEPKDIILKHFVDSAIILNDVKGKVLDMGTGAGFPGIPLKILKPDIEMTLVDSLNKRVIFLNEVIKELDLKGIKAIHARAEELGQNKEYREEYDVVVSRAVAQINILAEYTLPFTKVGGICIFMKSIKAIEELNDGKKAIKIMGGKIDRINELFLEERENNRNNIVIRKMNNTPTKFPRKAGKPSKDPIK